MGIDLLKHRWGNRYKLPFLTFNFQKRKLKREMSVVAAKIDVPLISKKRFPKDS